MPCYDNAGTEDGSVAMEELCLLLRLTAHVVADPGEGETPLMPLAMAHASSASAAAGQVSHACSFCLTPSVCQCLCWHFQDTRTCTVAWLSALHLWLRVTVAEWIIGTLTRQHRSSTFALLQSHACQHWKWGT